MATNDVTIIPTSKITCPECRHSETETMPTNACQWFYDCKGCGAVLKPKPVMPSITFGRPLPLVIRLTPKLMIKMESVSR